MATALSVKRRWFYECLTEIPAGDSQAPSLSALSLLLIPLSKTSPALSGSIVCAELLSWPALLRGRPLKLIPILARTSRWREASRDVCVASLRWRALFKDGSPRIRSVFVNFWIWRCWELTLFLKTNAESILWRQIWAEAIKILHFFNIMIGRDRL